MTTLGEPDPVLLAEAWVAADPDPETRAETESLLAGDPVVLADRFGDHLTFGTAGIRGRLGAGPTRMNRVLVRVVATALASLLGDGADSRVVVGFDARHNSRVFAEDSARIIAGKGIGCTLFPTPIPTPLLAFAVRHLGAVAGVMVTASHNPRHDNGYKIYGGDGAQLTAPVDEELSARIQRTALADTEPAVALDHDLISTAAPDIEEAYLAAITGLLDPAASRSARVAYSPLHGVGGETFSRAFALAGFPDPFVAPEQATPDPDFPTTPLPNPEEPGVLDPLLRGAERIGADVALANDPDADRLAVVVPRGGGWRLLSGDEVGALLADYLLRRPPPTDRRRLVANTIVSSRLLGRIAADHGADHVQTPTGFKWLMAAYRDHPNHERVLAYEEALGYAAGEVVADKDGISAALLIAEIVSQLADDGRDLVDLLDELEVAHGVHATGQRAVRFEVDTDGGSVMDAAMARLRRSPPTSIGGHRVTDVVDLSAGSEDLAPTNAVQLQFDGGRVIFRPSGTEPKLKVYGEVSAPVEADLEATRDACRVLLGAAMADAVSAVAAVEEALDDRPLDRGRADAIASAVPGGLARATDLRLVARCVDLTTLEGDDTSARIRALCAASRRPDPADPTVGPVAAVCVYPALVGLANELVAGSGVRVASVAGAFPSGLSPLPVRLADMRAAIDAGAEEVDIVLNRSAFLDGRYEVVAKELAAARAEAEGVHLKVILEVGELASAGNIARAADLAIDAGADVIKTSTGKSAVSATPAAVLVMAERIREHHRATGRRVGLKIAGGVRTADQALGYVALVRHALGEEWLSPELLRFGASSLLTALVDDLNRTERRLR